MVTSISDCIMINFGQNLLIYNIHEQKIQYLDSPISLSSI